MPQLRIIEEVDSRNISNFIPERKIFGLWWWRWEDYRGTVSFDTLKEATNWICYKGKINQIAHTINCEEL